MAYTLANTRFLRSQAIALLLFTTTLIILGCGHSSAANHAPAIPMSTVMDAIQQYGKGSSYATAVPPSNTKPLDFASNPLNDAPEIVFGPHMKSLLLQERFDDLESIAAKARTEKSHHSGGIWAIYVFYESVAAPLATSPSPKDWDAQMALLNKWIAAFPQSTTARLALATAFATRAWSARGTGYADSVDSNSWDTLKGNMALAKSTALEAALLKDKDPYWYDLMMQVSLAEGWEPGQEKTLFEQASAFEPTYYHYYRRHTLYLLPRWYGQEGEMEAFAEQTLKRLPEPTASMMYFDIVSSYSCGCMDDPPTLHGASWPKLKEGFASIARLYPASNMKLNRYAYLAYAANDKAAARDAFTQIDSLGGDTWKNRLQYETARAWALAP